MGRLPKLSPAGMPQYVMQRGDNIAGCITKAIDANGNAVRFEYDELGRIMCTG